MSSIIEQHPISAARAILLFPREDGQRTAGAVVQAAAWLRERGVRVFLPGDIYGGQGLPVPDGCELLQPEGSLADLDLVFALGGDGTLLRASRWSARADIPVVGANLGDLGFLSAYSRDSLYEGLEDALAGRLCWEPRLRMHVELLRGGRCVVTDQASNDINIKHGAIPRLVRLATYIGDQFMATYRADGLVVCTPLGSTAYNLAAGGPILEPGLNAFTITPLCPHSLTHRPVVTSASVTTRVVLSGPHDQAAAILTVDGQASFELEVGDEIKVRAAERPLRLVPPRANVFQVLASKLGWSDAGVGSDRRDSDG